ncbi:MAG: FAD-dependent oxidoreductase [Desulfobacteraceae bacterium]
MKHLIIGNGIAGVQAAETIRRYDPDSAITLIGGETFPPYCRPMIGLVLEGSIPPEEMVIRGEDFYASFNIEPVLGEWVQGIDVEKKEVSTDKGKTYPFDRLLIASGADPQAADIEGADLNKIFLMRNESDVKKIIDSLEGAKNALVLGCGLVGLKAAQGLVHRGLDVTIVDKLAYPLALILDDKAGGMVTKQLQDMGIRLKMDSQVVAFQGNGSVREAHLADGSKIPCDIVIVAIGVVPSTSFVPTEQIRVDFGIAVNEYLETTAPDVYAAGDVVECMDVARNEMRVNAIWPVAVRQGFFAGMNMAGRSVVYNGSLVRNVFRFYDVDILAGGFVCPPSDGNYSVHITENPRNRRYRKLVFRDDILVGLIMVNDIEQGGVLLSLIRYQIPIELPKDKLLQPSFNFSQLVSTL